MVWRNFNYDGSADTHVTDAPPDHGQAQAADEAFARDADVMVEVFRTELLAFAEKPSARRSGPAPGFMQWVSNVIARGVLLSGDGYLADFLASYGVPATLRACATAIQQHEAGTPRPEA